MSGPNKDDGFFSDTPPQPAKPATDKGQYTERPARAPRDRDDDLDDAPLPALGRLGGDGGEPRLKSLAQTARGNQLHTARWTLIAIGILSIGANIFDLSKAGALPPDWARFVVIFDGAFIAIGCAFIVLGLLVNSYPIPCTVGALTLYIVGNLATLGVFAMYAPQMIAQGFLIKIIVVAFLVRAVQAAFALEREKRIEARTDYGN